MKLKFMLFSGLLFCLNLHNVYAVEGTSIKAEVNKNSVALNENISYKLTIVSGEKQIPEPQLPSFSDFYILSRAQSQEVSFASGKTEISISYIYILLPRKEGRLKIEPAEIKINNKMYSSEALEIKVAAGIRGPQDAPTEPDNILPENYLPESQEPQITL